MKSGGFPCRYPGCDVRFGVIQQGSMEALMAASAKRVDHELTAHQYRHPVPPPPAPLTYGASVARRAKPREA